jgi:uncharacterized membrane protein
MELQTDQQIVSVVLSSVVCSPSYPFALSVRSGVKIKILCNAGQNFPKERVKLEVTSHGGEATEGEKTKGNRNVKQLIHLISTIRSIGRSPWALAVWLATLGLGLSATAEAPRRTFITSTPQAPPQVQYMVIELGGRRANDISGSGQIVGNKDFAPGLRHAAFWPSSQSAPIDLGTLPGLRSTAVGSNPRREIVGYAFNEDSSVERPLFWASPNSAPVELPGLPAGLLSEVYDINPSGQIVGEFSSADFSVERAVFWPNSNAAPVYLRQLSDEFPHGLAQSINASGNIFGDACDADFVECHAAFWATSTSTPVALASPGGEFIYTDIVLPGHAINSAGNMVGYSHNADFSAERAVFWASSSSPAVILSTVGEFTNAVAAGISDNGQIVGIGYNEDFSKQRPFIWPSSTSQGIDLTTFFPPGSGWGLDSMFAVTVNNRGEIVGSGLFKDGTAHNFVLIPIHGH